MNSSCKNIIKHPERRSCDTAGAAKMSLLNNGEQNDPSWCLLEKVHKTTVSLGLYFRVVTRWRVTALMLGVVFHNGPGVPAVLALSRPVGLKVPSPR